MSVCRIWTECNNKSAKPTGSTSKQWESKKEREEWGEKLFVLHLEHSFLQQNLPVMPHLSLFLICFFCLFHLFSWPSPLFHFFNHLSAQTVYSSFISVFVFFFLFNPAFVVMLSYSSSRCLSLSVCLEHCSAVRSLRLSEADCQATCQVKEGETKKKQGPGRKYLPV